LTNDNPRITWIDLLQIGIFVLKLDLKNHEIKTSIFSAFEPVSLTLH